MLKVKLLAIVLVLSAAGFQSWHWPTWEHSGKPADAAEGMLPTSGEPLNINAHRKVPGNPKAEIAKFQRLAAVLSTYSKLHGGAYPPSGTTLLVNIARNLPEYRFHSFQQVITLFRNPDSKFADDPNARANPNEFQAFTLPQTRPDGSPKDQRTPSGSQDVAAYSDLYYHQNVKHLSDDQTASKPIGFYIVLWESGQVETIAYDKILYVASRPHEYTIAFPGEAGVPKSALTYQQVYSKMRHEL